MISSDKPLADFSWATVVLYFCAIDHSVSPRSTLCDAASTSCAAKIADAIAAVAETDITIFLLGTNAYTLRSEERRVGKECRYVWRRPQCETKRACTKSHR